MSNTLIFSLSRFRKSSTCSFVAIMFISALFNICSAKIAIFQRKSCLFTDFNTIITLKSCNIQFVYPKGDMYGWWCGCVVVGWMLVTEMMGWMCGVGCHPTHRGKPLCFVMSPLQGRWMGGYPFT